MVDAQGIPRGPEYEFTEDTLAADRLGLAADRTGRFIVSWLSPYDSHVWEFDTMVWARVLEESLFSDGFESGDSSVWSGSVN